jgi:hypothetical protein
MARANMRRELKDQLRIPLKRTGDSADVNNNRREATLTNK